MTIGDDAFWVETRWVDGVPGSSLKSGRIVEMIEVEPGIELYRVAPGGLKYDYEVYASAPEAIESKRRMIQGQIEDWAKTLADLDNLPSA